MEYDTAQKYIKSNKPAWWFSSGRARKVLIDEAYDKNGKLHAWCFFKVLWRGHRVELEDDLLCFIYESKEECESANKLKA